MTLEFDTMPHEEAVERVARLPATTRAVFDGLLPELRAYALTVSGIEAHDELAAVRRQIAAVPAGEQTWAQAQKALRARLGGIVGAKEARRRAETLLRTHVFRGYAAARYRVLMAQRRAFPYWQYKTVGDGRVRPSHKELNGRILPAGHPVWQKIFPPWDWGCRCLVVPMLRGEVERLAQSEDGLAVEDRRVWDEGTAAAINAGDRLPNGVSILRTPTWAASPWSEPGTVRHDWAEIRSRYDAETLRQFTAWAARTEIEPGLTVADWLDGRTPGGPRAPVLPGPAPTPAPAPLPVVRTAAGRAAGTPLVGKLDADKLPKTQQKRVARVLGLIDQVHGDGPLAQIPVSHKVMPGSLGTYFSQGGVPLSVGYRVRKLKRLPDLKLRPELTLLHEIGHWLDQAALPGPGFSSQLGRELADWDRLVRASAAYKDILGGPVSAGHKAYMLSGRELWARSYAQYIAEESGDAELLRQLAETREDVAHFGKGSQWETEDFAPIRAEMSRIFERQGWRKAEPATP